MFQRKHPAVALALVVGIAVASSAAGLTFREYTLIAAATVVGFLARELLRESS